MTWTKLALEALSRVLPPAAEWLASKLTSNSSKSSNGSAEANRHATQSGAARNASSAATERMARCKHDWRPETSVSPDVSWRCSRCGMRLGSR